MTVNSLTVLNREVFYNDPTTYALPNDGVARVGPLPEDREDKQWALHVTNSNTSSVKDLTRRAKRESLNRISRTSIRDPQPAVWVSGSLGQVNRTSFAYLSSCGRISGLPMGPPPAGSAIFHRTYKKP